MLQFTSLASGSSGNCYCFNCNGYALLVDLGIGIRAFKRACNNYGLKIADIQAIVVTHDHTDHVKAVGMLAQEFHIPVYTSERVHKSMGLNHYISKKVPATLQHITQKGEPFELGPFKLRPFHVPHDSADNNGYVISVEGHTFVIMTDVGHFTDEMPEIVAQATHLIIEANYDTDMLARGRYPARLKKRISNGHGHSSNAETARFLADNLTPGRIERVWLCHLSAENNTPAIAAQTVGQALRDKGFILEEGEGRTLRLDVLPRKTPTLTEEI